MSTVQNRMKATMFQALGFILIIAAAGSFYSTYQFINTSSRAPGVVTKLNYGGSHPQVEFTTSDKQLVEYPQNGLIFSYRVGDKVDVLYQADKPHDAMINTLGAKWGFASLLFIIGLVFTCAPLAFKRAFVS
jgi:hypothetical protein